MKRLLTVLCAAVGLTALAASAYKTPVYSCGTVNRITPDQSTFIQQNKPMLAFAGLTLKELVDESYVVRAQFCGAAVLTRGPCYLSHLKTHSDGDGNYLFAVGSFSYYDDVHTKCVVAKFYDGEDGVMIEVVGAGVLINMADPDHDFVVLDNEGNITIPDNSQNAANSYYEQGYGIAAVEASKGVPVEGVTKVFSDPNGLIDLATLAEYDFSALSCGIPIASIFRDVPMGAYNKRVVTDDGGAVVALVIEFQFQEGTYTKCVVVEFTESEGDIYAHALGARYVEGYSPGNFVFYDGSSLQGNVNGVAESAHVTMAGYGAYEFSATEPSPQTVVIDADCTWSQIEAEQDVGATFVSPLTIVVNGTNPTLTFDAEYVRAAGVIISSESTASGLTIVFNGGSFTSDSLSIPEGFRCQMPIVNSVVQIASFSVGAGGRIAIAARPNENSVLDSVISGEGALEIVSGHVSVYKASSYTGGTFVIGNGSVLCAITSAGNQPFGAFFTDITIMNGGIFDIAGQYDYHAYRFVVDGGTLWNSGQYDGSDQVSGYGDITLKTDATIQCEGRALIGGPSEKPTIVDLGGHTLTAHFGGGASHLYVNNVVFTNGLVKFDNGSFLRTIGVPVDCSTASFDMFSGIDLYQDMEVSNFTYRLTDNWSIDPEPAGKMKVHGTFHPLYDYFANTEMCDGSTLDLTGKTGAWNTTVTRTDGYKHYCTFAEGATVTVDLTGREIANGDQIIAWDEAPAEVSFVAKGSDFGLGKRVDGLYAVRGGFVIIVK